MRATIIFGLVAASAVASVAYAYTTDNLDDYTVKVDGKSATCQLTRDNQYNVTDLESGALIFRPRSAAFRNKNDGTLNSGNFIVFGSGADGWDRVLDVDIKNKTCTLRMPGSGSMPPFLERKILPRWSVLHYVYPM